MKKTTETNNILVVSEFQLKSWKLYAKYARMLKLGLKLRSRQLAWRSDVSLVCRHGNHTSFAPFLKALLSTPTMKQNQWHWTKIKNKNCNGKEEKFYWMRFTEKYPFYFSVPNSFSASAIFSNIYVSLKCFLFQFRCYQCIFYTKIQCHCSSKNHKKTKQKQTNSER